MILSLGWISFLPRMYKNYIIKAVFRVNSVWY